MRRVLLIKKYFLLILTIFSFQILAADTIEMAITVDDLPVHGQLPRQLSL
jgi:hypothetical protein